MDDPSLIWISKAFSLTASSHKAKSFIVPTGELCVIFRAEVNRNCLINRELEVTPATKIPIIKITIDNSIKEKALRKLLRFFF